MKLKKMLIFFLIFLLIIAVGITLFLHTPAFGKHPTGDRLARIQASPNYQDGSFQNLEITRTMTGKQSMPEMIWAYLFDKNPNLKPSKPFPMVDTKLDSLPTDKDFYLWFGHSSYLLQLNGKRFLIDPVLVSGSPIDYFNTAFEFTRRWRPEDLPKVDYLIITHDHWDHLDYDTVKAIEPKVGKVITGLGVGEHLAYWGYPADKLIELDWQENATLADGFMVTALPARHFSGRGLKRNQSLWSSFMLTTPSKNVYVGGDSGYATFYADIAKRFNTIDLAILENGQYSDNWADIHTLPSQLPQTIKTLNPKQVVTVHNSKFVLANHAWDEPLEKIAESAKANHINLKTPMIGEIFYLDDPNQTFKEWWR